MKQSPTIVVEAHRWFDNGDHPEDNIYLITDKYGGGGFRSEGKVVRRYRNPEVRGNWKCELCDYIMHDHGWIDTAHSGYNVCPGDWIVRVCDEVIAKGVLAWTKYSPCKPDIFEERYEIIDERKKPEIEEGVRKLDLD